MTDTARRCGVPIFRCGECGTAVAPSRVRKDETCPRHPGAEVVDGYCERRLGAGEVRCRWHGGAAEQVKAKAVDRSLDDEVKALLVDQDVRPVTDPLTALQELLGEVVAVKTAFAARVDELNQVTTTDLLGRENVRALVQAYERALDRAGKLLVDASRLNLDERLIAIRSRVESWQAAQLAEAVVPVIGGLPPDLADVAGWLRVNVGARLRAVDAGVPLPALTPLVRVRPLGEVVLEVAEVLALAVPVVPSTVAQELLEEPGTGEDTPEAHGGAERHGASLRNVSVRDQPDNGGVDLRNPNRGGPPPLPGSWIDMPGRGR